jgi:nicotinamide mononucleotide transporter
LSFTELLIQQWQQQSIGEIFAVALAVAYVWLAGQESVWCWPAGFISTALYAYIYWDVTLFFQMLLNVYYMAMAVWGLVCWRRTGKDKIAISKMSFSMHSTVVVSGIVVTLLVYVVATQFLTYDLVLLDITLTVFSLLTTYLTVIKKLESWYYWSLINLVSIVLLFDRSLYLTMVLMFVYIVLAIRGLTHWLKIYNKTLNKVGYEYQ